jgi:hypothetical protein
MISPLFGSLTPLGVSIAIAAKTRTLIISSQGLITINPLKIATQGLL